MYEDAIDTVRVAQMVDEYFRIRKLKKPTKEQAMMWATTELGEAMDEMMKDSGPWVRNNPAKEVPFDRVKFVEELGDTIFMLLVAGKECGGMNALVAMCNKIERKINEAVQKKVKSEGSWRDSVPPSQKE